MFNNIVAFFCRIQAKQPLFGMEFVIIGETEKPKSEIEDKIRKMSGKIVPVAYRGVAAVISSRREMNNPGEDMRDILMTRIQVVPDDCIDEVIDNDPIEVFTKRNMNIRGVDVSEYIDVDYISSDIESHCSCMNECQN